jgi:hypothetical protein
MAAAGDGRIEAATEESIPTPTKNQQARIPTMARMPVSNPASDDKITALRQMLLSRGMDPRDFDIQEDSRSGISLLLGLAGGVLTLRRRSTGEIRVYASGPGSAWFATISGDLDRGYFRGATTATRFQRSMSVPAAAWA